MSFGVIQTNLSSKATKIGVIMQNAMGPQLLANARWRRIYTSSSFQFYASVISSIIEYEIEMRCIS